MDHIEKGGFEPPVSRVSDGCLSQLGHFPKMSPAGFEPTILGLEDRHLHPFGYGDKQVCFDLRLDQNLSWQNSKVSSSACASLERIELSAPDPESGGLSINLQRLK